VSEAALDARAKAANKYRPATTRLLFIAESPPQAEDRYFYFEDMRQGDWLWIALMKAVFGAEFGKATVHDRMPVILDRDSYDLWLDPGMRDVAAASELLKPCDARLMCCYPVSSRVNHVANDDEGCSAPVDLTESQARLFL
jgi:SOS response associated peptidase (SRAP)